MLLALSLDLTSRANLTVSLSVTICFGAGCLYSETRVSASVFEARCNVTFFQLKLGHSDAVFCVDSTNEGVLFSGSADR